MPDNSEIARYDLFGILKCQLATLITDSACQNYLFYEPGTRLQLLGYCTRFLPRDAV